MAKIIWLTGLSGSGKTTLCKLLKSYLKKKTLLIDGDTFRKKNNNNSFSRISIIKNNLKIISFCKKNFHKYDFILVSVISPLKKTRFIANKIFKKNYFEIYVFASLQVLISRDTKGLYNLSKKGKIKNLIGFNSSIKYEKSKHCFLRVNTNKFTKDECVLKILKYAKVNN